MDVDVLVVGAGLSGVGMASRLRRELPGRSVAVLEAREAIGGTWDLFRYPGVRSDSDMATLGYAFRPWTGTTALASGDAIRDYVRETARAEGVDRLVRHGHRVVAADWSSEAARWTVDVEVLPGERRAGRSARMTCALLLVCTGYYRYDRGFTPDLPGAEQFGGELVHPQLWPEDLDLTGKRVVVVGSGATAITLVPELARTAEHVVMLQRSPSYVVSLSSQDALARRLQGLPVPTRVAASLVRAKNVLSSSAFYQLSRRFPGATRRLVRRGVERQVPAGFDVDRHFSPRYDPWDQRVAFTRSGDLFAALRAGTASMVTDRIETLTATGVRTASGEHLDADVVVTATGLELLLAGGMRVAVDGEQVDLARTVSYKGAMLSGVPNLVLGLGYTNASWTLKIDLVARFVVRLARHLDAVGADAATPVRPDVPDDELAPLIDLQSGYVLRSVHLLPRQGPRAPWRLHQDYLRDLLLLRRGPVDDGGLRFSRRRTARAEAVPARPEG
ncbi:NAD(P)/FAD-dependent oxidoreductase [uncultured Pseudokineococcus sp.]|uniref:flavin-containing monooxygenase n=1 Tax=uncultured Pseudokineococcus sp. TaxID=1642928 RepID=UPI003440D277